jgi:hypothetical protein
MCCIKFFVDEWPSYSPEQSKEYIALTITKNNDKHPGYIPCPKCMEKGITPVKLKPCNCLAKLEKKLRPA